VKSCFFIQSDDIIYVLMPTNWLEGWTRQRWLERHFGRDKNIKNVSYEFWEELRKNKKVMNLIEKNNNFEVLGSS
tara:strand:+ start:99 stop:323 length:225 start_codon:yes stop_codon:yes gene_type:complete